jgi:inosine/xanthosine triphosphatase
MKNILVASLNPAKIEAARLAFLQAFPREKFDISGVAALSGVSNQPLSDVETLKGALNRLLSAQKLKPGADFYIAFEGGAEDGADYLEEFAWVAVTNGVKIGRARSAAFAAPARLRSLVIDGGLEVGEATDIIFNTSNSKQGIGMVGNLTNGALTRTDYYVQTAILSLLPFIHPELY